MIFGIGSDLVAVAHIREGPRRQGERCPAMLLDNSEHVGLARATDAARFLATRFAAKEAFSKAFGSGLRGVFTLHSVAASSNADKLLRPMACSRCAVSPAALRGK